jgi:membrane protease YdiL (CAAX protease family)
MSGLVTVVLIVPSEEIYLRGLLLDWCRQILAPLPSALITAAMFSLAHFQFLLHPGIAGWLATGAIAGLGAINAL